MKSNLKIHWFGWTIFVWALCAIRALASDADWVDPLNSILDHRLYQEVMVAFEKVKEPTVAERAFARLDRKPAVPHASLNPPSVFEMPAPISH